MNTEKLEALLLAIEKGSISAAAEQMNYTPSAVSRCIQSVEKELGIPLLARSKTGVEITPACEILIPDIRRIIQDDRLLREHAASMAEGASGTIRIGICYPAFYPWVSSAMASFSTIYPDVKYMVKNGLSSVLMDEVKQHELDLCMISKLDDSYGWEELFEDDMVAIIPKDHRYAEADAVPISIFADEPFLELQPDKDTDNSRALRAAGIHPQSIIHIGDSSALYPMVEAGLGIGMENRIDTLGHEGNYVVLPLDPPQILSLGIAFRNDILPVTRRFIDFLAESKQSLIDQF